MNMKLAAAALAALLLSGAARAEDAKPAPTAKESIMTFFRHLQESLSQSAVQGERKHNRVGSVAAVRGRDQYSAQADPDETSVKGDARSKRDKAQLAEDAEFAKAVDLVLAGKTQDGVRALEAFKAQHPKSRNLEKVEQAIDEAKGLIAAKPAEVPAPAVVAAAAAPAAEAPSVKVEANNAPAAKADAPAKK